MQYCFDLVLQKFALRLCFSKANCALLACPELLSTAAMRKPENQSAAVQAAMARTLAAECSTAALAIGHGSEGYGPLVKAAMAQPLLTMSEVMAATTYSRPSIYRLMGEGKFPTPLKLGANKVAFLAEEIERWLATRPRAGANLSERQQ